MAKEILVEAEIWNIRDEKKVDVGRKHPLRIVSKVDNGSWQCVLPESVADELKLPRRGQRFKVRYAAGRVATRDVALGLRLRIQGRDIQTYAIIEPRRKVPLIGAIALEDLGFNIDMKNGCLVPSPGTEDGQCSVIE